jgi:UDP-N-acetylmuramoylalanine--D-glutamate ligase
MNDRLEKFYRSLSGKRVAMLGIGVSNAPLVKMFLSKGAQVIVCDRRERAKLGIIADELEAAGAKLSLGRDYLKSLDVDIIFRTPGMKFHLPELDAARARGVAVTSEMEIFFELCPCKMIAVTGSDGKTTTTTLISEMLRRQGLRVHLGGNMGRALLPEIEDISEKDIAVVELSSFQLISMRRSPDIAVITNVSPNHLDMHKDMNEYIGAKKNILLHQNAFGRAVLNLDNPVTAAMADEARGQLYLFSRKNKVRLGCFCDENGSILMCDNAGEHKVMDASDILLPGVHNIENYLAAISAVWGIVDKVNIRGVAQSFSGVEHRMELVREFDGVKYYNDSIATSPTRTIAGLDAYKQKVILIAGGYDKNIPFEVLGPKVVEKVKCLILLGVTADKIEAAVKAAPGYLSGNPPIIRVTGLKEAVMAARGAASSGDIITLSPACASFDMFKNFEQRGDAYKDIVNTLA